MENVKKGKLYIPPCKYKKCEPWLCRIASVLGHVSDCVTKHSINGSFTFHFKQSLKECDFTIFHYCPFLWQRVSRSKDFLIENESKLILIDFDDKTLFPDEIDETEVYTFFNDFDSCFNLNEEDGVLESFKEEIVSCLPGTQILSPDVSEPVVTTTEWIQEDDNLSEDESDSEVNEDATYAQYPSFLQNKGGLPTSVLLKYSYFDNFRDVFSSQRTPEALVKDIACLELKCSEDEYMSTLKYILIEMIPKFYERKSMVFLACLSRSRNPIIQERALDFLELLVWEDTKPAIQDFTTLINVEMFLIQSINELLKEYETTSDKVGCSDRLLRVKNIYLVFLGSLILCTQNQPDNLTKCEVHLTDRRATLFRLDGEMQGNEEIDQTVEDLNSVLSGAYKCKKVLKSEEQVSKDLRGNAKTKKDLSKDIPVALVLAIKLLKRVFLMDKEAVKMLSSVIYRFDGTFLVYMTAHSLFLFLTSKSEQCSHRDISDINDSILKILELIIPPEPTRQMDNFFQRLLFNANSRIREKMIQLFFDNKRYGMTVLKYIENEIRHLLAPLLSDFTLDKNTDSNKFGWKKAHVDFQGQKATVHFHYMTRRDHKANKNTFKENDDLHYTEMQHLTRLQHKNIIKMLAYQCDSLPQFYILENIEYTLQENLKNKRNNEILYPPLDLIRFLSDAISGLNYCHNKGYAHCNLTAQSLIVVHDYQVKLCEFGLSKKIDDNIGKAKDVSGMHIPLRWSAPESIFEGEYSKTSDVWMFGHLIYEVITHGLLPYSTTKKEDEAIVELMKLKKLKLTIDHPIVERKALQKLLADCVAYCENGRPYAANIKACLKDIYDKAHASQEKKFAYPKIPNDGVSSSNFTKGIPPKFQKKTSVNSYNNVRHIVNITQSMDRIMEGNDFIFQEKVHQKLSLVTESLFKLPSLDGILPERRDIIQYSEEMPNIECKIPRQDCYSLLKVALTKKVKDLAQIFFLLSQVSSKMAALSQNSFVIGDLCAEYIYVQLANVPKDCKVHIISFAYMRKLTATEDDHIVPDEAKIISLPENLKRRASPEVLVNGQFSKATDVYCFGNLMWEVLTAFEYGNEMTQIKIFKGVKDEEICQKIKSGEWETCHPKPRGCPDSLYELIKSCVSVRESERPDIRHVDVKLKELCGITADDADTVEDGDMAVTLRAANPSIYSDCPSSSGLSDNQWENTLSSVDSLHINNPSVISGSSISLHSRSTNLSIANSSSTESSREI